MGTVYVKVVGGNYVFYHDCQATRMVAMMPTYYKRLDRRNKYMMLNCSNHHLVWI